VGNPRKPDKGAKRLQEIYVYPQNYQDRAGNFKFLGLDLRSSWGLDLGTVDSKTVDSETVDSETVDSETVDFGTLDSGTLDFGTLDFGTLDFGTVGLEMFDHFTSLVTLFQKI